MAFLCSRERAGAGACVGRGKKRTSSGGVQTEPRVMKAVVGGGARLLYSEALFYAAGFARLAIAGSGQRRKRCPAVDAADADANPQTSQHRHMQIIA